MSDIVIILIIAGLVVAGVVVLVIKFLIRPLPEWNGLHGEAYKKWKSKQ